MRKLMLSLLLAFFVGVATLGLIQTARGQKEGDARDFTIEAEGENRREVETLSASDAQQQPNIGFIDSPSATCYQPDAGQDACYLSWYYLAVDASPNYMITMTLTLNDRGPVAQTQGFFQTSMYVPYSMLGDGFLVSCGELGAGGRPKLGNAYAYTIRARDSAGLASANYGTAYCPAYQP
ncbi:MAG: hypothetical protein H6658_00775 [Ardenticatenaceae bacterium]|nr:hypothetical protein [Ardenticatenaceae bacterium]